MTELTKEKIMDVAVDLFMARGIRDVSIDEVCHELGISKKTFYVFYAKKEDLVRDTVSFQLGKRHDMLVASLEGRNPVQVLKVLPNMIDEYSMFESSYLRATYDLKKYYPKTFESLTSENLSTSKKAMGEFIDWGTREGFFRDDIDKDSCLVIISFIFYGFNSLSYDLSSSKRKRPSTTALVKSIVDIITHTLLSQKGWEEYNKTEAPNVAKNSKAFRPLRRESRENRISE
jgi:AcrR family transcriptional regulator